MATQSIYIVDDDQSVRVGLQRLLSTHPSRMVFSFKSGDAFIAAIADLEPGCILLDYNMPGLSGVDVLTLIKDLPRKFAPILLTGEGATSIAVQAWKLGALDFLEKPCDPALLLQAIDSAFAIIEQQHREAATTERAKARVADLTPRELDLLRQLVKGHANKRIAHDLAISPRTVEIHRANMMSGLGARSLSEALGIAFAAGFYSME